MSISNKELIMELLSGDPVRVMNVARESAKRIDELDERLAIMGETLTRKEWDDLQKRGVIQLIGPP